MDQVKNFMRQFSELSARERWMAAAALVGVVFFLTDFLWIRPEAVKAKSIRESTEQREIQVKVLEDALRAQPAAHRKEAVAALVARRDALRQTLDKGQFLLTEAASDKRLAEVIRSVAANRPGVSLVSLRTVPSQVFYQPVAVTAPPAKAASSSVPKVEPHALPETTQLPVLYKHGIEVVLQGQYNTLVPFLAALEKSAPGAFWGDAKIDAGTYPDATLRFTLFALSVLPELQLQ